MTRSQLAKLAHNAPDQLNIVDSHGNTWTRAKFWCAMNRLSRALRRLGLTTGDVLAVISPNRTEYLLTYMAAMQIGLYVTPVNWHLSHDEILHIVRTSGARAVVIDPRHSDAISETLKRNSKPILRLSFGTAHGYVSINELIDAESDSPPDQPRAGRLMTFTAATTGRPKGVKRSLADAAEATERLFEFVARMNELSGVDICSQPTHLCQSMLYHPAPLDCAFASMHLGLGIRLMSHWRAEDALELIEAHEIASTVMVPAMFIRLCKLPKTIRQKYSLRSLRVVYHGSAPCPVEIKSEMIDWWGPVFHEIYGTSEGGGTGITSSEWLAKPGSVGRAHPGASIEIRSDDGERLPAGTRGLIYIRPYTGDRFEYLDDPEGTRAAYLGEYFTAGDIGYLDEEGYLYICDRRTDVMIIGGVNVYSAEIERVLVLHPAVVDCAVFGIPDDVLGESILAVVQTALENVITSTQLRSDILAFLAARLSTYKLPARIDFVNSLPRDPAGKLFKRHLREAYWVESGRSI